MYEINGIVYAGSNDTSKITDVKIVGNYMLLLTFASGEKRIFDATQLIGPVYEPLKDIKTFEDFKLSHGVITWGYHMDGRRNRLCPRIYVSKQLCIYRIKHQQAKSLTKEAFDKARKSHSSHTWEQRYSSWNT